MWRGGIRGRGHWTGLSARVCTYVEGKSLYRGGRGEQRAENGEWGILTNAALTYTERLSIMRDLFKRGIQSAIILIFLLLPTRLWGQTDCEAGHWLVVFAALRTHGGPDVILKHWGAVAAAKAYARVSS